MVVVEAPVEIADKPHSSIREASMVTKVLGGVGLLVATIWGLNGLYMVYTDFLTDRSQKIEKDIENGVFNSKDIGKLNDGIFRVHVRSPWVWMPFGADIKGINDIGDHAYGNALRAVIKEAGSGCEITSVSRMDTTTPVDNYPQFGTFTVTTHCP
ncbi:MAG: hypothetical protein Q7R49_04185 [Candidatus Daviesbacteria bacterium]|nr:hypothetical protein [Candidatus Daviesbacteria bacterium]